MNDVQDGQKSFSTVSADDGMQRGGTRIRENNEGIRKPVKAVQVVRVVVV